MPTARGCGQPFVPRRPNQRNLLGQVPQPCVGAPSAAGVDETGREDPTLLARRPETARGG
jgi:hypothetical protein